MEIDYSDSRQTIRGMANELRVVTHFSRRVLRGGPIVETLLFAVALAAATALGRLPEPV